MIETKGTREILPAPTGVFDTFFDSFGRWPFPELTSFRRTMNNLLDNVMNPDQAVLAPLAPPTDVYEKNGKYVVECALPGYKKEEVQIEVADNRLIITAKTILEKKEEDKRYHYREVRRGSFARTIGFPTDIDAEHVEALFENGILKVTVPPIQLAPAKKVAIKG